MRPWSADDRSIKNPSRTSVVSRRRSGHNTLCRVEREALAQYRTNEAPAGRQSKADHEQRNITLSSPRHEFHAQQTNSICAHTELIRIPPPTSSAHAAHTVCARSRLQKVGAPRGWLCSPVLVRSWHAAKRYCLLLYLGRRRGVPERRRRGYSSVLRRIPLARGQWHIIRWR